MNKKVEFGTISNWANKNSGLITIAVLLLTSIVAVIDNVWKKRQSRNAKHHDQRDQLERNDKWRKKISDYIAETHAKKLSRAMVIRDFGRIDQYPKAKTDKGISPSFKVWLADIYHNGVLVHFGVMEITYIKAVEDDTNWYYCDSKDSEGIKVHLIGKVPYNRIETVNWQGDEWNNYDPQIFCRFDSKDKEPYEELVYCEEVKREHSWPFYREVVRLQNMRNERVC